MPGRTVIISAPSGAGKTTIVHRLMEAGLGLEFSVSACSRAKRIHEEDGKDYYFLSQEEFLRRIAQGEFLEWQQVYPGHYYGTLRSEIDRIRGLGHHVIFDVDVFGALNLKKIFGKDALAVFIMPPSVQDLEQRLRSRSTDSEESIAGRLAKARLELARAHEFDSTVVNDDLETAVKDTIDLVRKYLDN